MFLLFLVVVVPSTQCDCFVTAFSRSSSGSDGSAGVRRLAAGGCDDEPDKDSRSWVPVVS